MNKSHVILLTIFCSLALASQAQDTNSLNTDIGLLEARTGAVIIKGFGQIGSVAAGTDVISVRSKESTDISTGHRLYGLSIEIEGNPLPRQRIYVDDNEMDSLISAINFLIKIDYDVTSLPGFEASYTTKAGLRVGAHSIRRDGAIQTFLQYGDQPKIMLTSIQMTQLCGLIDQARKNLNALKAAK